MVWWRNLLKSACSVLIATSLILFIISLSFSQAFSYSDLKPGFIEVFKGQMEIDETELPLIHSMLMQNCTEGIETIEFPLDPDGESEFKSVILKCSDIKSGEPSDIVDLIAEGIFDDIYYKKHDISIMQIIKNPTVLNEENSFVIFSESASQAFKKASYIFLISTVIFIALIILLCIPKYTAFTNLGTEFGVAGMPFFAVKYAKSLMPLPEEVSLIFNRFFSVLSTYFLTALIIGVALFTAGIVITIIQKKKSAKKIKKNNKK